MTPRRDRARRGEGEKLREEILKAAGKLLLEAGDQASVSIRAIADEVGCTPPAIYMHFADKEDLFFQLCEDNFLVLADRMRAASESTPDPVESLRRSGEAYIRFALENPEHYRVLFMTQNPIPRTGRSRRSPGFAAS